MRQDYTEERDRNNDIKYLKLPQPNLSRNILANSPVFYPMLKRLRGRYKDQKLLEHDWSWSKRGPHPMDMARDIARWIDRKCLVVSYYGLSNLTVIQSHLMLSS